MSRLVCASTIAISLLGTGTAFAQPDVSEDGGETNVPKGTYSRWDIEGGFYAGGFISNDLHQFYDASVFSPFSTPFDGHPVRPNLDRVNTELGGRLAVFLHPNFGIEAEVSNVFAHTVKGDYANIEGYLVQAIFQLPEGAFTPYIAIGDSIRHTSSRDSVLGNDTDYPIHASIGVRYWLTRKVGLRADFRGMLGPAEGQLPDPHFTLRAAYGEFSLGLSVKLGS